LWPLLLNLTFAGQVCNTDYFPLKNVQWSNCNTGKFDFRGHFVNFNYYQIDGSISFDFIKQEIVNDTAIIFNYVDSLNFPINECIQNRNVDIYQIDIKTLNGLGFSKSNAVRWGLYDPRSETTSSIMLTEHGSSWNKIILAHELSHYWFDRMCWNKYWEGTPEDFALEFERFYSKY
jgi:hypothetical protein